MITAAEPIRSRPAREANAQPKPLRVGFVMHAMQVAGAEMLVAEIIEQLAERIQPTIFCLDKVGALGEQLLDRGVDVVCLQRRDGFDRRLAFRLAREIRRRDIEILHAHQYTPFFYAALARAVGPRRTRIMLTEHGRHWPDIVSAKRRWCNRLLLGRFADRINACCRFSAAALSSVDGFPADRVEVIYNGVDTAQFNRPAAERTEHQANLRTRLGLSPARKYVAMIARFHPVKDHATLLQAFARVCRTSDDADLLLVGDGESRAQMETLARDLRIDRRVHFWGVRSDVADILQAIDVFTLSSVSEAASLTLLEAMACGCPVVTTRVGGNPELIDDGRTGRLVPRKDPQALAAALLEVLDDPQQARTLGTAARRSVLERFQLQQAVDRYAALYEELAAA